MVVFVSLKINKVLTDLDIKVRDDNRNIIHKNDRPFYTDVEVTDEITALVPIRTHLPHKYGFVTRNYSGGKSGLDYTKMFLVDTEKVSDYKNEIMTIQSAEYKKIKSNPDIIKEEIVSFLVKFYQTKSIPRSERNRNQNQLIDFSALQYQETNLNKCIKILLKEHEV